MVKLKAIAAAWRLVSVCVVVERASVAVTLSVLVYALRRWPRRSCRCELKIND